MCKISSDFVCFAFLSLHDKAHFYAVNILTMPLIKKKKKRTYSQQHFCILMATHKKHTNLARTSRLVFMYR